MTGNAEVTESGTGQRMWPRTPNGDEVGPLGLEYLSAKDDPRNSSDKKNSAT